MSKKPTQLELLQQIVTLLEPMSNLSKFQIGRINKELADNKAAEEAKMATVEDEK